MGCCGEGSALQGTPSPAAAPATSRPRRSDPARTPASPCVFVPAPPPGRWRPYVFEGILLFPVVRLFSPRLPLRFVPAPPPGRWGPYVFEGGRGNNALILVLFLYLLGTGFLDFLDFLDCGVLKAINR